MQHLKSNKWIYFSIATYISCIILSATYSYVQERKHLCSILDLKLQTAALTVTSLLPDDFHHKMMKRSDLPEQQYAALREDLSQYATQNNLANIYTLILRDGQIFFSSASDLEVNNGQLKHHTPSFTEYTDASPYLYEVFNQSSAAYIEYNDRWGNFRSIFVPQHTKDGSVYLTAADISIDSITAELNSTLYFTFTVAALFMLFVFLPTIMHSLAYRRQVQCLRKEVEQRTSELVQSEAKLTSIFEHSPVGIFHYNNHGELVRTNRRFEAIVGAKKNGLIGFNMLDRVKDSPLISAVSQSLAGKVSTFTGEYTSVSSNKHAYLHADFVPLYSRTGKIEGGVGVCDDITERQLNTENLKKLSRVVECSLDGIIITNTGGIIEYANPRFSHITGYSASEAIGQKANFFRSGETADSIYEDLWSNILSGQEWTGELRNKKKNNELFWAQVTIVPMTNDIGEVTHFIGIQVDITEVRATSQQIAYQATHDMLTGLINRYEFEHELTKAVTSAQQNNFTHALCFLDLDQFKIINDTCGHAAGDELLRQVGLLIRSNIRQQDTLARLGGDEFAILIQHCDLQHAEQTANKILSLVKNFQFIWHNSSFSIGVSIGVAQISSFSGNTTEALIHADQACYAAKDLGRNRVHTYHSKDELLTKRDGEFRWVNKIKEALNEDRFELYAQPIQALSNPNHKRIFEVLLRLKTKAGEIIAPGLFLPAAERYNLSQPIDRWVVDHTIAWMSANRAQLHDIDHLSINMSGASLGDNVLLTHIMQRITEANLSPNMIKFEITETAAISNLAAATTFITTLREFGCQFSLDDFGSGLSSFAYLKNLPVSTLKIDGIFIKDILTNPIDEAMVKSINEIGHLMGLQTVAEFVENDAIKARLVALDVDFVQGYGIGKPAPIDNILTIQN